MVGDAITLGEMKMISGVEGKDEIAGRLVLSRLELDEVMTPKFDALTCGWAPTVSRIGTFAVV